MRAVSNVTTADEAGLGQQVAKPVGAQLDVRATPDAFGGEQAQEVGQLGQAAAQGTDALIAYARRDAYVTAHQKALDGTLAWHAKLDEMQQAAPAGAPGFKQQVAGEFAKWKQGQLDGASNDLERQALATRLDELQISVGDKAEAYQGTAALAHAKTQLDATGQGALSAALIEPENAHNILRGQLDQIEKSSLRPDQKEAMGLDWTQAINAAAVQGLLSGGKLPARAVADGLMHGAFPGLAEQDQLRLYNQADTLDQRQQAEARQEARIAAAEAQAAASQRMADNRADLDQRLQGEVAMRADRQAVKGPIVLADVRAAVPPHQVAKVWAEIQDRTRAADAAGTAKGLSFADQDALLAHLAPTSQDPAEYGNQAAAHDAAARAVSAERSAFRADQATYVAQNVPSVRDAFAAAKDDPSKMPAAVALSMQHQREIDPTADPVPLPKEAASDAVSSWKAAPDAAGKITALAPLTLGLAQRNGAGSVDDTLARKSLDQLEAAGLPAGADRALEAYRSGDENRAREIMAALSVKEGDLPKVGDATGKQLSAALATLYQSPNLASAEAHAAIATGQPGNVQMAARGQKLLGQLAQRYAANGETADDAVQHAYRTAYGDGATAGDAGLGVVPVPRGVDKDQLETGLTVARRLVDVSHLAPTREAVKAMLSQGGKTPSDGEVNGALAQATGDHALWADDVRTYSRWAPAPGGFQLVLPSGQAVTGADGKPRVWSTDEVIHHAVGGTATAPPLVPSAEGEPATQGVATPAPAQGKRPGDVPVPNPLLGLVRNSPDESGLGGAR